MTETISNPKQLYIKVGSVVQINPLHVKFFAACFLLVTEVKRWGVQGFVMIPTSKDEMPGQAYYRVKWEYIEYIGKAEWIPPDLDVD